MFTNVSYTKQIQMFDLTTDKAEDFSLYITTPTINPDTGKHNGTPLVCLYALLLNW